ncbi:DUF4304 domain-containing protein [Leifsonia sp. NPDC058194]|uniref:DUF4304 domain-containing protein n=1 Tax=Leifsonia sp. NPDC058194 TaxID=3346374 RepID=UPI0036DBE7BA
MTENGEIAKSVGAALAVPLKAVGFRKRANSFNRRTHDGMVHVMSVQLGRYERFGETVVSGSDLWGRFTVKLGVYVPEMGRMGSPRGSWVNEYNCQLRWRLGNVMPDGLDQWWDLRDRLSLEEVTSAVVDYAVPKLDSFPDAEGVLAAYATDGCRAFGGIANDSVALDVADLHLARGDQASAENLLCWYIDQLASDSDPRVPHHAYVREYLAVRGMGHLGDRLR